MRVVDLIRLKRDGGTLGRDAMARFVADATSGAMPDYQVAALLMAMAIRGLSPDETWWLTDAMVRSGVRLDLRDVPGAKVDKHSTGGVGDKISLVVAPLAAACGAVVPMMSGRALGDTGGTLDKLESIPGFRTALDPGEMRAALAAVGCVLIGQTAEIAPADRRLYALRDVTGTVESAPLITASIMSKKLAEGIDALVLDVKAGSGAFMKTDEDAEALAASVVAVGTRAGLATDALVTDMDVPLGRAVGNALEVVEAVDTLKNRGPADVESLSLALASRMLQTAGIERDGDRAERRVRGALASGAALEKLRAILECQGGDPRILDDYARLPQAPRQQRIAAARSGYVARIDAGLIGRATVALGAGRDRVDAAVDHAVGIRLLARPGDPVRAGDTVLELHFREADRLASALPLAEAAIEVADAPPVARPLIRGLVAGTRDAGPPHPRV